MNLPDLKQLDKIIGLCRKRGVKSIKIDNVELTLSDDAPIKNVRSSKTSSKTHESPTGNELETSELTEEQLLFYSVQDIPGTPKDSGAN